MLTGIKLRANPTSDQKLVLSQWMGCARSIWNAKVDEERYYRTFARKYYPIGTYAPIDHAGSMTFDFCDNQKKHMSKSDRYIKRLQRKLARQQKGSSRRNKTKHRIATHHAKKANIRNDFAHKTSRSLVDCKAKVIVFEALSTSRMTRKSKAKQDEQGRYVSNICVK